MKMITNQDLIKMRKIQCLISDFDDFDDLDQNDIFIKKKKINKDYINKTLKKSNQDYYSKQLQELMKNNRITDDIIAEVKDFVLNKSATYKMQDQDNDNNSMNRDFIKDCIRVFGNDADLNWIDVSDVTDFRGMFAHSSFNGNISNWEIPKDADCSYMFAFSEFESWDKLPEAIKDALVKESKDMDTTGIFYQCKGKNDLLKRIADEQNNQQQK